jgi:L-cystine uptake protein TcyP (sodium:dicarboxylate symporter family)
MTSEMVPQAVHHRQPWYKILYIQVLIAIFLGVMIGWLKPGLGKELKPLGDAFIALIKMMIAPVIFCTVVHGISSMGDLKRVADLFRGGLHGGARGRPDRRRNPQARSGLQHRSRHD